MYVTINDASYWYEVTGQGPPVVLLHGFTGSSATWNTVVDTWYKEFRFIRIDLPGHGKTRTQTPRTMQTCCDDLMQLLTYLEFDKVHLLGYSMGGRTGLSFAMMYPEMVASLILESASPGLETENERRARMAHDENLAQKIEQEGISAFVNFWEDIPLFQTQRKLPPKKRREIRDERLSQSAPGLVQSLRYMGTGKQPSWWEQVRELSVPVLLVAGALDEKFVKLNQRLKNRLQSGDLIIVEDVGHAIHVEQPTFFGKIVTEFILKVCSKGGSGVG
ncbi:putative 2-succinyl-6-hydroxy-2,4-cyclohexadiene-1-carboxylate synthase [Lentibacillus populi]|uniref:Putative 2-succinyl-6-hydroxy-2,4-cyclohexadiene-1-carboxylate synthase n=1 Tax=Lentibacillus populi TaxID=1827502 RepID=A0A9W5TVW1_9BACI|nr:MULTISPECIES: 2-succinyl-6-hydroxy-2,4-cyclohexadiene-1-carboxylate synthase [Bacillaceae]MBT2217055.1 2-succinyl-6-hydroxy-2,4-cyclohexadiene-1-carboxylate synthase [Virgibacillus dakarensis]GGB36864.1 putative 2-succinyl-6-hydroxy-2,4-cyclohexadiene-1-carboxylate synthase [Lentibacillus populi]